MDAQAIPWDDLRIFLAVARRGTLSGAARELGVHHTTVFRRVRALEERIGESLFDRHPEGYALTPAGEEMQATADRMSELVSDLDRKITGRSVELSGRLRVTTPDTLAVGLLPRHLAAFRAEFPFVELELAIGNEFLNLSRREADVAIRPSLSPGNDLFGRRVSKLGFAPYASVAYVQDAPPIRKAADLADHPILEGDDSIAHIASEKWLAAHAAVGHVAFRGNSILVLQAAAREHLGVAMLPCFLGDPDPALVRLLRPVAEASSELWVLCHSDLRRTARVRAFLDFIGRSLAAERSLLRGGS